jgi:hypothetical protein
MRWEEVEKRKRVREGRVEDRKSKEKREKGMDKR